MSTCLLVSKHQLLQTVESVVFKFDSMLVKGLSSASFSALLPSEYRTTLTQLMQILQVFNAPEPGPTVFSILVLF